MKTSVVLIFTMLMGFGCSTLYAGLFDFLKKDSAYRVCEVNAELKYCRRTQDKKKPVIEFEHMAGWLCMPAADLEAYINKARSKQK